jgi:hypothetical protein
MDCVFGQNIIKHNFSSNSIIFSLELYGGPDPCGGRVFDFSTIISWFWVFEKKIENQRRTISFGYLNISRTKEPPVLCISKHFTELSGFTNNPMVLGIYLNFF